MKKASIVINIYGENLTLADVQEYIDSIFEHTINVDRIEPGLVTYYGNIPDISTGTQAQKDGEMGARTSCDWRF